MKQLHEIQLNILKNMLFRNSARYSDLKPEEMEPAQFVFHLNRLIQLEYIEKIGDVYSLTAPGKEYANRMTTEITKVEPQTKITTVLCAVNLRKTEREFLIYKRLKNPFYGCYGFPTEKAKWGENFSDTAKRGLKEETSYEGTPILFAIRHYKIFTELDGLVEDKLMHAFLFENPKGNLTGNEEGEYQWVYENDLEKYFDKPLEEFKELYETLINFTGEVTFKEFNVTTENF